MLVLRRIRPTTNGANEFSGVGGLSVTVPCVWCRLWVYFLANTEFLALAEFGCTPRRQAKIFPQAIYRLALWHEWWVPHRSSDLQTNRAVSFPKRFYQAKERTTRVRIELS